MLFLLVSAMLAQRSIAIRAAISLGLAFSVEFSQLYHAPWIDSIRQTTLGGLVLGSGFLGSDLICYSVGIAIGAGLEWVIRRFSLPTLKAASGN
jgi:glycopeptide antibiotics resistance protein